jgi:hypothetical protein
MDDIESCTPPPHGSTRYDAVSLRCLSVIFFSLCVAFFFPNACADLVTLLDFAIFWFSSRSVWRGRWIQQVDFASCIHVCEQIGYNIEHYFAGHLGLFDQKMKRCRSALASLTIKMKRGCTTLPLRPIKVIKGLLEGRTSLRIPGNMVMVWFLFLMWWTDVHAWPLRIHIKVIRCRTLGGEGTRYELILA